MFYAPQSKGSSMAIELGSTEAEEGRWETGKIQIVNCAAKFKEM